MRTSTTACLEAPPLDRLRAADYLELTKPRVAVLVLFTVAVGFVLAAGPALEPLMLVHTLVGTALVAAGASALNQWLERHSDGSMKRTENRPLPAGRLQPFEVVVFGAGLGALGVAYLALTLDHRGAALVAAATFASYVFIYTPLKRRTTLNTLVGAVPGALPPVIGWTAARGSINTEIIALFLIVFLWQVPHFLAIAWIYRDDYTRAGLCMLPSVDRSGAVTGRYMVIYCLALILASIAPTLLGNTGPLYAGGAILLGLGFLYRTVAFFRLHSTREARRVLRASLVYLPVLFLLLVLDGLLQSVALALWP